MTQQEAKAWLAATERSRYSWQLDQIHCTTRDALIYRGGPNGYYVNLRQLTLAAWGIELGIYDDAIPHIGDAAFNPLGRQRFTSPADAVRFMVTKIRIPQSIGDAILRTLPENRDGE